MLDFYDGELTLASSPDDTGGILFGPDVPVFKITEIRQRLRAWEDIVGKSLEDRANKPMQKVNEAHCDFWNGVNKMKDIEPQQFTYTSCKDAVEGLWIDL